MNVFDLYRYLKWQSHAYGPVLDYSIEKEGEVIKGIKLTHTIKNDIGDRFTKDKHWQYKATVYANGLTYELYWFVRQATSEPKEFLRGFVNWDKEETEEGSNDNKGKVCLYKNDKLVGMLEWLLVSP